MVYYIITGDIEGKELTVSSICLMLSLILLNCMYQFRPALFIEYDCSVRMVDSVAVCIIDGEPMNLNKLSGINFSDGDKIKAHIYVPDLTRVILPGTTESNHRFELVSE
jgi:hypothetical protein